ncbi:hypothetical protein [Streptomyces californicus]|uniref:hypothetical protein n=1 Tax=Streptomyces californicus TaxID=67351 RepID=UPI00296FBFB5|nr:hypothetical protein [Streptomyces californicus]MDW4912531.1 hypothetical protein [Streptomyces californicus]
MSGIHLTSLSTSPVVLVAVVILGLGAVIGISKVLTREKNSTRRPLDESKDQRRIREERERTLRVHRARRIADIGTYIFASIATFAALLGMWPIAQNSVKLAGVPTDWVNIGALIAVGMVEGTIIISGIRARANILAGEPSGADGIAMWVAVTVSAILASIEVAVADHNGLSAGEIFVAVLARLAAPVIAGFLWERGLAPERRATGVEKVHSLITLRRLLVRLGLAAPHTADLGALDRDYRLAKVARHIANAKRRRHGSVTGSRTSRRSGRRRRGPATRWSEWRARTTLITAVRSGAIQPPDGMSLGDHVGLHALTEELIEGEAAVPLHLATARPRSGAPSYPPRVSPTGLHPDDDSSTSTRHPGPAPGPTDPMIGADVPPRSSGHPDPTPIVGPTPPPDLAASTPTPDPDAEPDPTPIVGQTRSPDFAASAPTTVPEPDPMTGPTPSADRPGSTPTPDPDHTRPDPNSTPDDVPIGHPDPTGISHPDPTGISHPDQTPISQLTSGNEPDRAQEPFPPTQPASTADSVEARRPTSPARHPTSPANEGTRPVRIDVPVTPDATSGTPTNTLSDRPSAPTGDPGQVPRSEPTPGAAKGKSGGRRTREQLIAAVKALDPDQPTLSPNYVSITVNCSWNRAKELLQLTGRLPDPEPAEGE